MAFLDHNGGADFPFGRDEVFDALRAAVRDMDGMTIDSADKLTGRLVVKGGVSWRSWGETIPISVTEIAPGRARVSITSTPRVGALGGLADFGKNRENIERIVAETSRRLKRTMPGPAARRTPAATAGDPAARLETLKSLLDRGLISAADFEKRKAEILADV